MTFWSSSIGKNAIVLYLNFEGKVQAERNCFMSVSPGLREVLARRIAGEIILSSKPGSTMKKWRELFAVSQINLSEAMGLSSSVISDYESGRRKSPGAKFIRRFVLSLLHIDEGKGSRFIREFAKLTSSPSMAVVDLTRVSHTSQGRVPVQSHRRRSGGLQRKIR